MPQTVAGVRVLVDQPRAEQQRVVGPERDPRAPGEQLRHRDVGHRVVDAEADVARRAHLEARCPRPPAGRAPRGPRPQRTPWPSRSGASADRSTSTWSAPSSSPPWGTDASPARRAIRNAGANSSVSPRRSSLLSPKPTTSPGPSPAYRAARRASVRASSGCRSRLAATTTATWQPVAVLASRAASRTTSSAGVRPPTSGAYEVGSTCSSSRREPSAASSAAASCTRRRMSCSSRTQARAAS